MNFTLYSWILNQIIFNQQILTCWFLDKFSLSCITSSMENVHTDDVTNM